MTTTTTKTTRTKVPPKPPLIPPLDWAAPHGPITGALSATSGAYAAALLADATHMPGVVPAAVCAAGALGHGVVRSLAKGLTWRSIGLRTTCWLVTGGWTWWAIDHGPLSWAAVGSLAALGVGIGGAVTEVALHEEAVETERQAAEQWREGAGRRSVAAEWEARIKAVAGVQVRIIAVEDWENGNGFTLEAELPASTTWDRIRNVSRALASDARLPLGCAINVIEGVRQGLVLLDVPTVNLMTEVVDYPEDFSPLSILTGLPWGLWTNQDPILVFLREACALVLGPPGSGKSTFCDVVLAGFSRCTDVLTWVIDLKGGAIGIPWVRPWLEARGYKQPRQGDDRPPADTRPGIDWLAATPKEALLLVKAALVINIARQHAYADLMHEQDTTLLPVSARIPQIQILIDEGAELLSVNHRDPELRELKEAVLKLMRTTRAMGERLVLTAVDGNVSALGDTSVRKFSPLGVALTSGESSGNNLSKLFPGVRIDTSQLTAKGAGVIGSYGSEGFAPGPFKGWRTAPSLARRVTLATNHRRPWLDEASLTAVGDIYEQRWSTERAGWLWNAGAAPAAPPAPRLTGPTGLNLSSTRAAAEGLLADQAAQLMREIDEQFGTTEEPQRNAGPRNPATPSPRQAPSVPAAPVSPSAAPAAVPALLTKVMSILHGADGIHTELLAIRLNTTVENVGRLMLAAGVNAHPNAFRVGGVQKRGYKRAAVEEAIARITSGDLVPPPEVRDWTLPPYTPPKA